MRTTPKCIKHPINIIQYSPSNHLSYTGKPHNFSRFMSWLDFKLWIPTTTPVSPSPLFNSFMRLVNSSNFPVPNILWWSIFFKGSTVCKGANNELFNSSKSYSSIYFWNEIQFIKYILIKNKLIIFYHSLKSLPRQQLSTMELTQSRHITPEIPNVHQMILINLFLYLLVFS